MNRLFEASACRRVNSRLTLRLARIVPRAPNRARSKGANRRSTKYLRICSRVSSSAI
jgi:hypothetical protein